MQPSWLWQNLCRYMQAACTSCRQQQLLDSALQGLTPCPAAAWLNYAAINLLHVFLRQLLLDTQLHMLQWQPCILFQAAKKQRAAVDTSSMPCLWHCLLAHPAHSSSCVCQSSSIVCACCGSGGAGVAGARSGKGVGPMAAHMSIGVGAPGLA